MNNLYKSRSKAAQRFLNQPKSKFPVKFENNKSRDIWGGYGAISSLTEIFRQRCN